MQARKVRKVLTLLTNFLGSLACLSDNDCTEHNLVADTPTNTALQELYKSFENAKGVPNEFK